MPVETSPQADGTFLHPASLILIWLAFAFSIPWLRPVELVVITGLFSLLLIWRHTSQYFKLIRRSRWLLISIMLVYAFATPGVAEIPALGAYSPSREGLLAGGLQVLRLITLLASLTLMLASVLRDRILAGLYVLSLPFRFLGVNVDRFAARTWLTLNYVEKAEQTEIKRFGQWRERLQMALNYTEDESRNIKLEVEYFSRADYAALLGAGLMMAWLLARGMP